MITANTEKPSNLADVIGQVEDALDQFYERKIPVQVGEQYLSNFGVGSGPKILFVPETPGGKIDEPISMGESAASYVHHCDVHIRTFEGFDDDLARYNNAYDFIDKVIGAIRRATTGRVVFGAATGESPTATNAYGSGIAFGFTYRRDIPHWDAVWQGTTEEASGFTVDPTVSP